MSNEYVYQELQPNHIRLLSPVATAEGLGWTLRSVDLHDLPCEYEALSYTWGSLEHIQSVSCDGKKMSVHLNLYQALPFLAQRAGGANSLPIWIDAVCINQKDEDEKAIQLRMMNRIYRQAKAVWVWLGCAAPNVQEHIPQAIALLPVLIEQEKKRLELKLSRQIRVYEPLETLQNLKRAVWDAILHLTRNSWNRRVWIVQEAALANNLIFLCGENRIDADMLEAAVEAEELTSYKIHDENGQIIRLPVSEGSQSVMFYIRAIFRKEVSYQVDRATLLLRMTLLMEGHSCTMPKDRVLGMMGLLKSDEITSAGIDVSASTTLQDLYTQFSTFVLLQNDPNETQFWWPFFNRGFAPNRSPGLPSWVPDLHHYRGDNAPAYVTIDSFCKEPKVRAFQASWRTGKRWKGARADELGLRGKFIDEVYHVYNDVPLLLSAGDQAQYLLDVIDWEANLAKEVSENGIMGKFYGTSDMANDEAYWKTLCAENMVVSGDHILVAEDWMHFRHITPKIRDLVDKIMQRNAAKLPEIEGEEEQLILEQLKAGSVFTEILAKVNLLAHRRLFLTKKGRFGLATRIQSGDSICIFHGASTPHVLRAAPARGYEVFSTISDAYVCGLMQGRIDLEEDDLDAEEVDIVLV